MHVVSAVNKFKLSDMTDLQKLREECQRSLSERAKNLQVLVHMGTCGISSGSKEIKLALEHCLNVHDVKAVLVETGCAGMCHKEPVITIIHPNGSKVMYGELTEEKIKRIVQEHLKGGSIVQELRIDEDDPFLTHQVKRVTRLLGLINPLDIREYIANDGYEALARTLTSLSTYEVIDRVKKSGLKGRGGAGFPTGLKWSFAARAPGDMKYVVCNADEGDPGAYMDRAIMEGNPHSVLEGLVIAAYAIGAKQGYVYIRAEYPLAVEILQKAIDQAKEYGLIGSNVLGTGFDFDVEICLGAGAFVCGEETALIASIEGKRGNPRPRPPFPANKGFLDKPTIINNVKTLANIPLIFLRGSEWFASVGTEKSKGTMIFSLTGKIKKTGLIEVPLGITLGEVIFDIGGGVPNDKEFRAVQLGGPSGGCIPSKYLNTPIDYDDIKALGAIMGSGGMIVMDEDSCMIDMARFFMEFTRDESCGKCTSCRAGIPEMLSMLEKISNGEGDLEDLDELEELALMVKETSLCGLGQTAPNPVLSTLRHFREEYIAHIVDKRCPAAVCQALFKSPCQHTCPLGTDIPAYASLISKGKYEEAYLVIRQNNPLPSVCGRVCHHPCELKCRRVQTDEPISINHLKRFLTDYALENGIGYIRDMGDKKEDRVAIIGAGPAGLSAAYDLVINGYNVTIFEALPVVGGMLHVGIPEYRLPRRYIEADVAVLGKIGVKIQPNAKIDNIRSLLKEGYNAIFIATGAHLGRKMKIQGEDLKGVYDGVEFLRNVDLCRNIEEWDTPEGEELVPLLERLPPLRERTVAVVGGGNVAIDCARVAKRLGAEKVYLIYRRTREDMPAIKEEIEAGEEEGIILITLANPVRILGQYQRVSAIECVRMELTGFDESGRKKPSKIKGTEFTLDVDIVIEAIGQRPDTSFLKGLVETRSKGLVAVDERTLETNVPGIFAGGDAVTGPKTVVEAIAAGQRAALSMMCYLQNRPIPKRMTRKEELDIPIPQDVVEEEIVEKPRIKSRVMPPEMRTTCFDEVVLGYTEKEARKEADRCLRCDLEVLEKEK